MQLPGQCHAVATQVESAVVQRLEAATAYNATHFTIRTYRIEAGTTQTAADSGGGGPDCHTLAAERAVHPSHYATILPHRRAEHQVTLTGRAARAACWIADHSSDLARLIVIVGVQRLAALHSLAALDATTAVDSDRERHTPPVSVRAALG
ncbi:MAG: hypothetical protein JSW51_03275 [Gemmatimonadota bacterium]|nr:MAG: hypothetical protein JSW51_03275 [Gemmatimonadota bacterium]